MKYVYSMSGKLALILAILILLPFMYVNAQSVDIQKNVPALKDVFKNDFSIGCLLSYAHIGFTTDPYVAGQSSIVSSTGGNLIKYHMNTMSPGNWMKSTYIVDMNGSASDYNLATNQTVKDSINVHPKVKFNGNIIAQLNWAKRQGFAFRGHTLVWHSQHPGTAFFRSGYTTDGERLSKEKMAERLENYIKEVIRIVHEGWPGLLIAMDVVNEAINEDGSDRTTDSEWYLTFGDNSYVMKAFEFARKYTIQYGETQMKLYYNDYRTHVSSKANGIVRLCSPIYRAGYLDGIGMQEHDAILTPTAEQWIASYNKFDTICTEMTVTELDVKPDDVINLTTQANQYANLFKCFLDHAHLSGKGKIVNVSKDGLNDEWAFVKNASLWDAQNQCKEAYYKIVKLAENYHNLEDLFSVADTLHESNYQPQYWSDYILALTSSRNAMKNNYSSSVSAADVIGDAKDNLKISINNLLGITGINNINDPEICVLGQNYPNPFYSTTTIDIVLPEKKEIQLFVYDETGRLVSKLVDGCLNAGLHKINFDASKLTPKMYYYSLISEDFKAVKKLILLK